MFETQLLGILLAMWRVAQAQHVRDCLENDVNVPGRPIKKNYETDYKNIAVVVQCAIAIAIVFQFAIAIAIFLHFEMDIVILFHFEIDIVIQ
jgi:hypothetical protein